MSRIHHRTAIFALVLAAAFPAPAQTGVGTGLKGSYYPNTSLNGAAVLERVDATLNFQWATSAPASGVPSDKFSVRWTGKVEAPVSGAYTFYTRADDGIRLWVNRQLLINHWSDHGSAFDQAVPVQLTAGQKYDIQVEYYENLGSSTMQLFWSYPGQATEQVVPQTRLYPVDIVLQPAPPPVSRIWLSDLPWISAINGDGPPQLDGSNGGSGNSDSRPITINGRRYSYGLGVHARSEIRYALDDRYDLFRAVIGIDDEVGAAGSVVFEVWGDGRRLYQSPVMTGAMPGLAIAVPVENIRELSLRVNGSSGVAGPNDHADWAEARFEGIETVKYLSNMNWISATNGLGPVERDRSNGGAEAGDGTRIQLRGQTYAKGLGTKAPAQIKFDLDRKYELFSAIIGIDDLAPGPGSAVFEVWTGSTRVYQSPVVRRGDAVRHVVVPVTNVEELTLKVLDSGDGSANDLADWADAKLLPLGSDWAAPTAPTGLDADPGNGRITLTWNAAPNAVSYSIYRGTSPGGEGTSPVASGVMGRTWTNNSLANGVRYYYKIKAVNPNGMSGFSNEDSAVPGPMEDPPAAPRGLDATGMNGYVKLAWQASTGAVTYNVYRATASGGQTSSALAINVKTTQFNDATAKSGTRYYYKVKAVNPSGMSGFSNEDSAVPVSAAPSAPTGLDATAGNGSVTLKWNAATGATSYNVYRGTTPGGESTTPVASGVTQASYTNTGLTNGTKYYFKIRAVNAVGMSPYSNEDSAIPGLPSTIPPAPTGLSAAAGDGSVRLTWVAASGAASYNVYRGTSAGGQLQTPIATGITGTSFTNTGLTNGTAYFYKVAAVNAAGTGPMSNEASATPRLPLTAPGNLTAVPGDTVITLSWTAATNATSYNIYRGTAAGGQSATPVATGVTDTTFQNTALTNGVRYYYKVAAVNSGAAGPMSNEASATPAVAPAAPTGLTAAPGNGRVTLSWTAVTGAARYNIYRSTAPGGQGSTPVADSTTTTYVNTGLTNGTAYFFKVAAVNVNNVVSALSAEASATPIAPPAAPAGLSAAAGDRQITLTWTAVTDATSYNVYAGTTSNGQSATPVATGLTSPTILHAGLTNGTDYYYKVTALNAGGESPRSAQVSASPLGPAPTVDPATLSAFHLLRQASWGPKPGDVDRVKQIGRAAYLQEQFAAAPSVYPDTLYDMPVEVAQEHFMRLAITGNDQLRQRVAWALHKIWVVSAVEIDNARAIVPYQRIFLNRAFGNYRDLMTDITLNPAMGRYLNMLNNRSQAITGALPNENYARELMQLFTLGLVQLNVDGTPVLDGSGRPAPTYTEDDVKALARIFTGWTFGDGNPATIPTNLAPENYTVPMEAVQRFHDTDAKTILGTSFASGRTAREDLDAALDLIFNHPNVGPFVSKQLIQMLVTSNPSPAYVEAVAAVFNDNGSGVRGDLAAVVRAILEHPDAELGTPTAGKLMEPALFVIAAVRGLDATVVDHPFMSDLAQEMGQRVFYPGSVFSYFSPGFRIRGTTLAGPEFQILTSVTAMSRANYIARLIGGGFGTDVTINFTPFTSLAGDPAALTDFCNLLFMGGQMSEEQRSEIISAVRVTPSSNALERARTALYLTLTSAQHQVDR